jgi:DNA topoisomerase VI subunit B
MHSKSFTRIENEPHLRKDPASGAVVNVSADNYNKYLQRKRMARKQNERLDSLESDLHEVKDLLRSVLDRLSEND